MQTAGRIFMNRMVLLAVCLGDWPIFGCNFVKIFSANPLNDMMIGVFYAAK
jgi:hypothetical protein